MQCLQKSYQVLQTYFWGYISSCISTIFASWYTSIPKFSWTFYENELLLIVVFFVCLKHIWKQSKQVIRIKNSSSVYIRRNSSMKSYVLLIIFLFVYLNETFRQRIAKVRLHSTLDDFRWRKETFHQIERIFLFLYRDFFVNENRHVQTLLWR